MKTDDLFNPGTAADIIPEADAARQAVDSLRGYAYQALAAALAWLDIDEKGRLFLEVAEDYAIVAADALRAVQVKDTQKTGSVTLNSRGVRDAVAAFVDLVDRNPGLSVGLRYFTTSEVGIEQAVDDRPAGLAGLAYWRKAASGADLQPLRVILESEKFSQSVREFVTVRDDDTLRRDLLQRIHWDCGKPEFSTLRQELEERLIVVGRDRFDIPAQEARRLADTLVFQVLRKSVANGSASRVLTRAELYEAIDATSRIAMRRSDIDALANFMSGLAGSFGSPGKALFALGTTGWIIDGTSLPSPRALIPRKAIELEVVAALKQFGACVIAGGSGLGKSQVSRAVADSQVALTL